MAETKGAIEIQLARYDERFNAIESITKSSRDDAREALKEAAEYNKRTITIIFWIFTAVTVIGTLLAGIVTLRNEGLRSEFTDLEGQLNTRIATNFSQGDARISKALGESKNRGLAMILPTEGDDGTMTSIFLNALDDGKTQIALRAQYRITGDDDVPASYAGSLFFYEGDEFIELMKRSEGYTFEGMKTVLTQPIRTTEAPFLVSQMYPSTGTATLTAAFSDCMFALSKANALLKLSSKVYINIKPVLPDYEKDPNYYRLLLKIVRGYPLDFCETNKSRKE